MKTRFFNVKDLRSINVEFSTPMREAMTFDSAEGKKHIYDVFLSHSTKDMMLIKQIRKKLEDENNISVYIDWDEDSGASRDDIANIVKDAMKRSRSFLVVKTDNSDDSSWVSWETGYFDNKDANKIGVLLVEDEENGFTHEIFHHQEYLKSYEILGQDDIVEFINSGASGVREHRLKLIDTEFRNNNIAVGSSGGLQILNDNSGSSTKFFGEDSNN